MVIDADGITIHISRNKELLGKIPAGSILTPHAGEFERLFGKTEKIRELALENAAKYNVIIAVKGPDTFIALPSGNSHVNTTGNPGMATGGTGDVLTRNNYRIACATIITRKCCHSRSISSCRLRRRYCC